MPITNPPARTDWKESVRVATTAAGTLASDFENGDTIDGITLSTDDRLLLKNQSSGVENGIYVVNASGAPTRADDYDAGKSVANTVVMVEEGTANADKAFQCTNNVGSDVVATDALVFVEFGGGVSDHGALTGLADDDHAQYSLADGTRAFTGQLKMDDAAGPALQNEAATATNPTVLPNRADPDTGLSWRSADSLTLTCGGVECARFGSAGNIVCIVAGAKFRGSDTNSGVMLNEASSATNPTLIPDRADETAGIGGGSGGVYLITAGVSRLNVDSSGAVTFPGNVMIGSGTPDTELQIASTSARLGLYETDGGVDNRKWEFEANDDTLYGRLVNDAYSAKSSWLFVSRTGNTVDNVLFPGSKVQIDGNLIRSVTAGITASTTQTQGQGPLTKDINEISVCVNTNDTVTLPTAVAGARCLVINNGAQTLKVFPASGDNLGAGVNTATTIAAGSRKLFETFDATNWEPVI